MATERRLIDADELLNQIAQADADVFDTPPPGYVSLGGYDWGYSYDTIARIVQNTPTVDAVEVVRCKDCRHRHTRYNCQGRSPEWYCPNGERK